MKFKHVKDNLAYISDGYRVNGFSRRELVDMKNQECWSEEDVFQIYLAITKIDFDGLSI